MRATPSRYSLLKSKPHPRHLPATFLPPSCHLPGTPLAMRFPPHNSPTNSKSSLVTPPCPFSHSDAPAITLTHLPSLTLPPLAGADQHRHHSAPALPPFSPRVSHATISLPVLVQVRTSTGTFLAMGQDEIVKRIERRVAQVSMIPVGEECELVWTNVGQYQGAIVTMDSS